MKIGIIDSGIGGIDILNKVINKYPNNEYIYLCDNLNVPYGIKTREEVNEYIIDDIRSKFSFPIYTILDYNVKILNEKYQYKKVSIIATSLTIRSEVYLYKTNNIDIQFINGSYLTKLIEDQDINLIEKEITSLIKQINKDSNAILLGCTHYGLFKNNFINKLYSKLFIEGSKELIYDLPLKSFKSHHKLDVILTKYDENYIEKIKNNIKYHFNIHNVSL